MLPWWKELVKIPGHNYYQEFAWKVHASFEVPKTHNEAKGVDNDHIPCQDTHPLGSIFLCHPQMWGSAVRTTDLPNHTICCLCKCASVLGWEGPTTNSWSTSLSGKKYGGTLVGNGATALIYREGFSLPLCHPIGWRWAHPCQWGPPHETPLQSQLQPKLLGPPKGVPVGSPWQRLTYYHQEDRHTCYSTLEDDAAAVWPQAPMPSARFAEIAWALRGEKSVESGPTLPISILPKEAVDPY